MSDPATVMTVTGPVAPDRLGVTQTHEHLLIDATAGGPGWADARLSEEKTIAAEVADYRQAGGRTLVELTTRGLKGRNLESIRRISETTGVQVVLGTGFFSRSFYPPEVAELSADELAEQIIRDLTEGFPGTSIRAGIIGEIGTGAATDSIDPLEQKVFRAAAWASRVTGVAVTTHTEFGLLAMEQAELLGAAGVSPQRIVIGHLDTRIDRTLNRRLARMGVYLQFDAIGKDHLSEVNRLQFPTDEERADALAELADQGHIAQLLLSSDICRRRHLRKFGGFGYDHILTRFVPLLKQRGFSDQDIETMLVTNPQRMLTPQD